ncbi:hypothetical protein D3C72_1307440 [compost metagenome]
MIELKVTWSAGFSVVYVGRSGPHANRAAGTTIAAAIIATSALLRFGAFRITVSSLPIMNSPLYWSVSRLDPINYLHYYISFIANCQCLCFKMCASRIINIHRYGKNQIIT